MRFMPYFLIISILARVFAGNFEGSKSTTSNILESKQGATPEERDISSILLNSGCRNGTIKCQSIDKCIEQTDICNNKNDCGNFWDETQNCQPPKKIFIITASPLGYTSVRIFYKTSPNESDKNYTTLIKLKMDKKLFVEKEAYPTKGKPAHKVFIDGLEDGKDYTFTLEAVNILGVSSGVDHGFFKLPKKPKILPFVPSIHGIEQVNYNSISVKLYTYVEDGQLDLNYTTTFKITDENGQKAADDVVLINSKVETVIGNGNLKNDTTYLITIESFSVNGKSEKPFKTTCTIPRMVPPGPVKNLEVEVTVTLETYVGIELSYDDPNDNGGTVYPKAVLKKCRVYGLKIYNCEIKYPTGGSILLNLPGKTTFYFEVYMISDANQKGATKKMFYTTPATDSEGHSTGLSTELSTGQTVGISVGISAFIVSVGIAIIFIRKRWLQNQLNIAYVMQ